MKGILMKPDMIQATVEGRKTNTRRVIKIPKYGRIKDGRLSDDGAIMICFDQSGLADWKKLYPRYCVGETVYIKEAWAYAEGQKIIYKASESDLSHWEEIIIGEWRSPFFMPAWAARHFILIEAVRVERLQEITLEGCKAEGIAGYTFARGCLSESPPDGRWNFIELWDSINPKYPWDSDPWVRVYQFRLVC